MTLAQNNLTTYGEGSGNAPTLVFGVGHLKVVFSFILNKYEQFNLNPSSGY